ncbi:MAG: hypothetical protein M3Y56_15630, partial [Armatimonadota bacterium]|nr:hypothetical protein [Armatimonadota bacterium]
FHTVTGWGCKLYEQDWLAFQYRKVDALQTQFGLGDEWMNAMDDAAAHWSLPIQFCMPSIGFYIASSGMPNVTQIRSSQDFGRDSWENVRKRWMEHGQLSLLAAALGMVPSKDVLLTTRQGGLEAGNWEETEALLATLSRGPVGIGDGFGFTDSGLVSKMCTEDGVLVQPDRPALPTEASVTGDADAAGLPMMLETSSTVDGLTWRYVMTLDLKPIPPPSYSLDPVPPSPIPTTRAVSSGFPPGGYVAYDYLHDRVLGLGGGSNSVALTNGTAGQSYTVLAPILSGGLSIIGDISRFVTASPSRISSIRLSNTNGEYYIEFEMNGPANSAVRLVVFDGEGQPTLQINGEQAPSEVAKTRLALLRRISPAPPGVSAGLGQTDGLWYFSFHLPASGGPIKLRLKSATDDFPGPIISARGPDSTSNGEANGRGVK